MRKNFIYAALAIGGAAAIGLSKDSAPTKAPPSRAPYERHEGGHEQAEAALRDYYKDTASGHFVDSYEVGGVRVFNAVVTRNGYPWEAQATVTGTGEIMSMGLPVQVTDMPPGAQDTVRLFKTAVTAVSQEDIHSYFVAVKVGGLPYDVEFDGAGRIRNVKSTEEIEEDSVLTKVVGPMAHHMAEMTAKRFAEVNVDRVFQAKHDPGYYLVVYHTTHDRRGWAIINPENDITEWRAPIHRDKIPEAVWRGIERELRGDHVTSVTIGASRLYEVKQMVGGELVSMLLRPNGAVEWISTRELHRHFEMHH